MLSLPPSVRIFVAREPVDLRKGFDGLSAHVIHVIDSDPQSGHLFVFWNRRKNRVKILWWERTGYTILYRRLDRGRFHIFDRAGSDVASFEVEASELTLLLDGIDLRGSRRRAAYDEFRKRTAS